MNRFQGISCLIRFQRRYIILVENTNFSNQMLYRSVSLHENFQCFGLSAVLGDMINTTLEIYWVSRTNNFSGFCVFTQFSGKSIPQQQSIQGLTEYSGKKL